MGKFDGPSRCSSQKSLKFRWYGYPEAPIGKDLETAIEKFLLMIETPNRIKNDYIRSMAKAEFKRKIELASKGQLFPITEVQAVDKNNSSPLYEIRWQGITVRERQESGQIKDVRLVVRMYHSEPFQAPNHFIGHHVHEKDLRDPNTVIALQNQEILVARRYFAHGLPTLWGISDLT